MKKSQTLIKNGTDKKYNKINEGDLVFAFQANRVNNNGDQDQLETNMDWAFDDEVTPQEIKRFLGSILASVEDVFGEKMVTEAISHYVRRKQENYKKCQVGKLRLYEAKDLSLRTEVGNNAIDHRFTERDL